MGGDETERQQECATGRGAGNQRRQLAGNFANYSKRPCRQDKATGTAQASAEAEAAAQAEAAAERQVMAQVAIYQLKLCLTTRTPEDNHHKKAKRSNSLIQVSKIEYPKLMMNLNNCIMLIKFIIIYKEDVALSNTFYYYSELFKNTL